MEKQTFKEYCQAKENLRLAVGNIPQVTETYELTKYCRFPILTEDETVYLSFKPKDFVEVVWEMLDNTPHLRSVKVTNSDEDHTRIQPAWGEKKFTSWLDNSTRKKVK